MGKVIIIMETTSMNAPRIRMMICMATTIIMGGTSNSVANLAIPELTPLKAIIWLKRPELPKIRNSIPERVSVPMVDFLITSQLSFL